jgi:hypothetical protein
MTLQNSFIRGRDGLGEWMTSRGLVLRGVEVGTHLGEFAETILLSWPGVLVCVDPWESAPFYDHQIQYLWGEGSRESHYDQCRERLARFGERAVLLKETSERAAAGIPDDSLCFAYIDANHERKFVEQDIQIWWRKIRPGGVLCGHDFVMCGHTPDWGVNTQPAVFSHASLVQRDVRVIVEEGEHPWSWMIVK